jgi:hypothetical protein
MNDYNEAAPDRETLEQALRAGLRQRARAIHPEAAAFWAELARRLGEA